MDNGLIQGIGVSGVNYINIISVTVLIFLTGFFLWLYDQRLLGGIGKSIRKLNIILNHTSSYEGEDEKTELIDEDFMKVLHPAVVMLWHGYTAGDDRGSLSDGLTEAGRYFTISRVVNIPTCRKQAEAAPALLTLIGTALSLAVMMAHLTIGAEESRSLAEIILSSLIPAIAAALLAIIYTLIDRMAYQQTVAELDRLIVTLENKAHTGRSMIPLKDGKKMSVSLTNAIETSLNKNLLPSIESLHDTVLQFSQIAQANEAELLDRLASGFINKLGDMTGDIFNRYSNSLAKLYELQQENADRLGRLATELSDGIEGQRRINLASKEIINSIMEKHREMLEFNLRLAESLDRSGPIVQSLSEAAETNSRTLESINEKYGQLHENLDTQLEGLFMKLNDMSLTMFNNMEVNLNNIIETMSQKSGEVNERYGQLHENLDNRLEELFIKLSDTTSILTGSMEDSLKEFLETLSVKSGELMEHLKIQSESVGSGARDIAGELDELNFRLESSVREFNEQMHQGIGQTFLDFDKNLSDICNRFSRTITEIRDTIESIHSVLGDVKKNLVHIQESEK